MTESASLRVLTSRNLFRSISAFVPGLPFFIEQLKTQLVMSSQDTVHFFVWRKEVELARLAIRSSDTTTLKALLVLSMDRDFEHLEKMFSHLLGYAVTHTSDLALLDWIYEHFTSDKCRRIGYRKCEKLGERGDVAIVKWIFSRGCRVKPVIVSAAASCGQLELIRFLHEFRGDHQVQFSASAMDEAATNGHLDVVKFLHENREEGCTERAMDGAARNNHIHCVRYMHETFPERFIARKAEVVKAAAANGSLACIEYFHRIDEYPFTSKVMHLAATEGHMSVVQFLHENRSEGCKFETIFEADRRNQHHVVDYLCCHRPMKNPGPAIARAKSEGRYLLAMKFERRGEPRSRGAKYLFTPAFLRRLSSSTYLYSHDD